MPSRKTKKISPVALYGGDWSPESIQEYLDERRGVSAMPNSPPDNRYWSSPVPENWITSTTTNIKPLPQLSLLSDNDKIRLEEILKTLKDTFQDLVNQDKVSLQEAQHTLAELYRIINPPISTPFDNFNTASSTLITTINSKKEK